MSRTKNFLEGLNLTDQELNEELYMRADADYHYDIWKNSHQYIDMVNDELLKLEKIYNQFDIANALQYASDGIKIEPQEVGKEVYDTLFSEKVLEYLKKSND
jgi:hypothetical protein|tara:strand:- start:220 stop:525 length:306 start_codon:yes stop_codon:yes gene_type:complete